MHNYQNETTIPEGNLGRNIVSKGHERSCQPKRSGWPEGKFSFFAPHCLSVQKVQTTSITQNSDQVSPTSNYNHHPMFVSHVAVSEQRKSLYNESARPVCLTTNFCFLLPTLLSVQKVETSSDYAKLCSGVPTTCKKNYDSICIH